MCLSKTDFHITQSGLEMSMYLKTALSSCYICLHVPSSGDYTDVPSCYSLAIPSYSCWNNEPTSLSPCLLISKAYFSKSWPSLSWPKSPTNHLKRHKHDKEMTSLLFKAELHEKYDLLLPTERWKLDNCVALQTPILRAHGPGISGFHFQLLGSHLVGTDL